MAGTDLRTARELQRKRENRETILQAARAVIRRKGFGSLSMDDVAAEAQFSKATVYRYFRSKSELAFEILILFLDGLDARLRDIRSRPAGAGERMRDWVACSLGFLAENENLTRILLLDRSFLRLLQIFVGRRTAAGAETRFLREIMARRKAMLESSQAILREGMASGEFRAMDLAAAVRFVEAVIEGYFVETFWDEKKPDIERDASRIAEFLFRGIRGDRRAKGD